MKVGSEVILNTWIPHKEDQDKHLQDPQDCPFLHMDHDKKVMRLS